MLFSPFDNKTHTYELNTAYATPSPSLARAPDPPAAPKTTNERWNMTVIMSPEQLGALCPPLPLCHVKLLRCVRILMRAPWWWC